MRELGPRIGRTLAVVAVLYIFVAQRRGWPLLPGEIAAGLGVILLVFFLASGFRKKQG